MIIKAESLIKTYISGDNTIYALNNASFQIYKGEKVAVTGPSGSGKSTLMNIIGCLDQPDSGSYILAGEDVASLTPNRLAGIRNKRIGFVFQTFNLIPRLSALENVELPLLYAGNEDAKELAIEALKTVNLKDRLNHQPNRLSGGQCQRVAIARAIVTNPDIILADEPTGNLDTKTGTGIMDLFENLNEQGRTIIIVTHDRKVADQCGRRLQILDGVIQNEKFTTRVQ
jgi:putative ABC transport system ATP-binding protein